MDEHRRLIEEQIDYYRTRAPEYDETSAPPDDPLTEYGREIEAALDRFRPAGNVLEIASGTGTWTRRLLHHASAVTALDSSPKMHDLSRKKLGNDTRVLYIEADIFSWEPDDRYDVIFFSNWLSHVPPPTFERFWALVHRALAPRGRVFFVDEIKDAWRDEALLREDFVDVPIVRRRLRDGRTFRVVKIFWDPEELGSRLRDLGWNFTIHTTGPFFWGGSTG
ncbi:MAG: class I SAM-dependent methyltransferase [Actinomycetota bacterium]